MIPGWGRSRGGRHGNPLQYSCLKSSMDRGAWRAVHGVSKEWDMTEHTHTHPPLVCIFFQSEGKAQDGCTPLQKVLETSWNGTAGLQDSGTEGPRKPNQSGRPLQPRPHHPGSPSGQSEVAASWPHTRRQILEGS